MTTKNDLIAALEKTNGNKAKAAAILGMAVTTFKDALVREGVHFHVEKQKPPPKLAVSAEQRYKSEILSLKSDIKDLVAEISEKDRRLKAMGMLSTQGLAPPRWLTPKKKRRETAIATAFLSDCHFDEVVKPEHIGGVNEYNREIANERLRKFFINSIRLCSEYMAGIDINDIVLPLGGDMINGNIHDEFKETNEAPPINSILYWAERIAAGIDTYLDHFEHIYVPCVVGNHGRLDKKPKHKNAVYDNFDYLMYKILEIYFRDEKRVTFDIALGRDLSYKVYDTRYLLTHGDQFRGGSGIAGMLSPLMIGDHRKRKREMAINRPYDYMIMGHWHQLAHFKGIIVNGSLKGYDEFASDLNFDYEPPQQAFWLTDQERGKTISAPIHL